MSDGSQESGKQQLIFFKIHPDQKACRRGGESSSLSLGKFVTVPKKVRHYLRASPSLPLLRFVTDLIEVLF